jgi:hypothetical protein
MATSSLDPGLNPRKDRQLGTGHGTDALGPSDTSDSGSDIRGGVGLKDENESGMPLQRGTTSDQDEGSAGGTAGPDVGDANLDSDTDAVGTGEHKSAGRDATISDGRDIDTDQVVHMSDVADEVTPEDSADEAERETDESRRDEDKSSRKH